MPIGDATGGFQHTENTTGQQIVQSQQNVAGAVGDAREVQMPQDGHMQSWGDIASDRYDDVTGWLGDKKDWLLDKGSDLVSWGKDKANQANNWAKGLLGGHEVGGQNGVFVGINTDNVEEFKGALTSYINGASDIVSGLNIDASLEMTIKGTDVDTEIHEFLASIKTLLEAYINSLNALNREIDEVVTNYVAGQKNIGTFVSDDAATVRQSAGDIDVA